MAHSLRRCWPAFLCAAFAIGCSSGMSPESRKAPHAPVAGIRGAVAEPGLVSIDKNEPADEKKEDAGKKSPPIPRKVQYVAEFRLVADDFAKAEESLHKVVEEFGGFISFADVYTEAGAAPHGTWKARIPVEKFEPFRRDHQNRRRAPRQRADAGHDRRVLRSREPHQEPDGSGGSAFAICSRRRPTRCRTCSPCVASWPTFATRSSGARAGCGCSPI